MLLVSTVAERSVQSHDEKKYTHEIETGSTREILHHYSQRISSMSEQRE